MKVLIYGLNYAPELTGIGRYSGEMGPWLKDHGVDVRVVTTPPYYPHWKIAEGYSRYWFSKEVLDGVPVWRCPFYVPSKPTTVKRLIHLGSFAAVSFIALWRQAFWRPDWVFMVEPASMTIPGGLVFSKVVGAKSWLHIQDFEMEAMLGLSKELGGNSSGGKTSNEGRQGAAKKGKLLEWAKKTEAFLKRQFDRTSSISQVMMAKLGERGVPKEKISFFPNWVDIDFMSPGRPQRDFRKEWKVPEESTFVLYSGNIGKKQGLEMVLEVASDLQKQAAGAFTFIIVGEGAAKDDLVAEAKERELKNIQFHPLQPYEDLPDLLRSADIHLVIQKKGAADAVLPSKLTSILSVGGHSVITAEAETELGRLGRDFPGMVEVIEPEEPTALRDKLLELREDSNLTELNEQARQYAEDYLERDAVLGRVLKEMKEK
ncbi:MAG: WcaI family glycosyltransferase [Verrucomicrobiota bacterium JB023]|nr:WcaI family glycosyltransferase [Verrucomicrobiota bacterium JB023]